MSRSLSFSFHFEIFLVEETPASYVRSCYILCQALKTAYFFFSRFSATSKPKSIKASIFTIALFTGKGMMAVVSS